MRTVRWHWDPAFLAVEPGAEYVEVDRAAHMVAGERSPSPSQRSRRAP